MAVEAKGAEGLTREEMLAHIESSPVKIEAIPVGGPGTGKNPNLYKLNDDLVRSIYDLVICVEGIMKGETF